MFDRLFIALVAFMLGGMWVIGEIKQEAADSGIITFTGKAYKVQEMKP